MAGVIHNEGYIYRDEENIIRVGQWPYSIQGILQFLGIFHGGKIKQKERCYVCAEKKKGAHPGLRQWDSNHECCGSGSDEMEEDSRCDVCESLQWNSEGKVVAFDENDIVTGITNNRLSRFIAIMSLLVLLAAMCFDAITLVSWLWGKDDQVLHLVSFLTFWIPVFSVPVCCLIAHVCNVISSDSSAQWFVVFNPNYIARRLQFLLSTTAKSKKRVLPSFTFMLLCLLWAFTNAAFEILNYYVSKWHKYRDYKNFIHLATSTISMIMFSCFCYLLHLLRDSLDCEYNQVLSFIMKHRGNVDLCRCRIVELFRDYRILRKVVRTWMILILSCASLGLTVHVSWNYAVYTRFRNANLPQPTSQEKFVKSWTNILIGSEKLMLLFLPLLALGGYNLENSWQQFYHAICIFREEKYNCFWKKLSKMVLEMHPRYSSATVTIVSCVVGWFFGLHLGNQNTNYIEVSGLS